MRIGYLDWLQGDGPIGESRFQQIGAEIGATFHFASLAGATQGGSAQPFLDKWERVFLEADAFIVTGRNLPDPPVYLPRIRDAIVAGKSALFDLNPNRLSVINPILAHFDMVAVLDVIANADPRADQSQLCLRRDDQCMRSLELFSGVESVTISTPRVIWYHGSALPLLVATARQFVVDEGDLRTSHDPRQCACMVGWCGPRGQVVIVVSGGLFYDPYDGGVPGFSVTHWRGIGGNEQLARNLFSYLTRSARHESTHLVDGTQLCDRIEINLCNFVLGTLKGQGSGTDWWTQFVPLPLRQKCAGRREEEGNRCPPEAYFDLTDLKTIISDQWRIFEPLFRQAQAPPKKSDALAWIDVVNTKYRRFEAHPLKRAIAGFRYGAEDLAFLRDWDGLTLRLVRGTGDPMA